eukprot:6173982-Pleurochrysis_carterae.AAC.2
MAVAGSVRTNDTLIVTANGTTRPKQRCDVYLPLLIDKGNTAYLRLQNVLVLDNASHNLISLARLAKDELRNHAKSGRAPKSLPGSKRATVWVGKEWKWRSGLEQRPDQPSTKTKGAVRCQRTMRCRSLDQPEQLLMEA